MSNKQTTVAPAEQASKQVPTEELDCDSNHAERGFPCLCAEECQPAAPVAATEQATIDKIADIRALLDEAHNFKSTSRAAQDNINAALDLLDSLATPADAGADEQMYWQGVEDGKRMEREIARLSTSAAPVTASLQVRKATDELSLPELAEQFAAVEQLGCDYVLSAKVCGKLFRAMTTQPEFVQSTAPVTAEPASWILQARSPEGDPWQNITPEQYSAANAAGYETRMVPAAPQPAAQVPSIDPDSAMQTAEQASQEWAENQKRCGFYFTDARRQIYRDGFLAAALKGQPAAAHAAKTDEQREREQIEARAKEIYSTFPYAHLFPWRERFNSIKQDEARAKACAELKSAAHAAHDQKGGGNG